MLIANIGICISDFVGVGAALGLAGIPVQLRVPIAAVGIWLIIVRGSYRSAERVFIWLTIPFFAYPIAAILAHPHWGDVGKAIVAPHIQTNSAYLLLFVATAGTTITPYMQLYLQSAVVERGVREEDCPRAARGGRRRDLRRPDRGLHHHRHRRHALRPRHPHIDSAAEAAKALAPFAGQYAEILFGIGLLGASLLAAAILPIATSYVVAESLGFEKGLGHGFRRAPVFVGVITAMIVIATIVAVIPACRSSRCWSAFRSSTACCCRSTSSSSGGCRATGSSWVSTATGVLARLHKGPESVGELAAAVGMEGSAVSHQLRLMRHLGLVVGRRDGRQVVYALHDDHVAPRCSSRSSRTWSICASASPTGPNRRRPPEPGVADTQHARPESGVGTATRTLTATTGTATG